MLLICNCAAPVCFAQSPVKSANTTKPAEASPNAVAPVSPPPVAPPAAKTAGGKSDAPPHSSGSSSRYDPLNPPEKEATSRPPSPPRFDQPEAPGGASKTAGNATQNKPAGATASTPAKAPAAAGTANSQPLLQPQVPKIAEPVAAPDLTKNANAQPGRPAETGSLDEKYPAVANLEVMTFGETHPKMSIGDRLANLETTVFKVTHPTDSLFVRTERLQKTLVGNEGPTPYESPQYRPPDLPSYARMPPPAQAPPTPAPGWSEDARTAPPSTGNPGEGKYAYFEEIAVLQENRVIVNGQQLQDYFLEMVNTERRKVGSPPLEIDPIAEKLATEHVTQLAERAQISHCNVKGENPDRRYTLLGGTDAVTESLVSLKAGELGSKRLYRGAAAKLLRVLMSHQDDRDALTSRDSTHVGFAAEWTADRSRLIACAELVSKHAIIHPTPTEARVEEKIDVKGVMSPPYQFVRVTLAWEGGNSNLASVADESEEALPYFPPLDYIAYQRKSESGGHDRAIMILKGVGIAAAIAGGVFMPPVALAAPLIAVSGSGSGEHKPASEIPVKGGVKVEGNVFETKVPLSNENKDGLYYLTVWGSEGQGGKPVPISRRVIYVGGGKEEEPKTITNSDTGEVTAEDASKKDVKKNEKKAKKKNKSAPPSS